MMQDKIYATVTAISAVSIASALFYSMYLAVAACSVSAAILLAALRHWRGKSLDRETLRLVNNIIGSHTPGRDTASLIIDAASPSMPFYDSLVSALRAYGLSGDSSSSFSALAGYPSVYLRTAVDIILNGLDNGADIAAPMRELKQRMEADLSVRERTAGSASGASAIIRFGSILFLPVFAGISLDILGFASTINSAVSAISPWGFTVILSLFIVAANTANFRHGASPVLEKSAKAAVSGAVAITVFKLAAIFAMSML